MTASDYTDLSLHQLRERELTIRNELRRVTLERQDAGSPREGGRAATSRSLRARFSALVARVPARG